MTKHKKALIGGKNKAVKDIEGNLLGYVVSRHDVTLEERFRKPE
jgi:hypothetical protein